MKALFNWLKEWRRDVLAYREAVAKWRRDVETERLLDGAD